MAKSRPTYSLPAGRCPNPHCFFLSPPTCRLCYLGTPANPVSACVLQGMLLGLVPLSILFGAFCFFDALTLTQVLRGCGWSGASALPASPLLSCCSGRLKRCAPLLALRPDASPRRLPAPLHPAPQCTAYLGELITRLCGGHPVAEVFLIVWGLGHLIEGASGFGTPGALLPAIAAGLGHDPFHCVVALLIATTTVGPFGSSGWSAGAGREHRGVMAGSLPGVCWQRRPVVLLQLPPLPLLLWLHWRAGHTSPAAGIGIWFGLSALNWPRADLVRASFLVSLTMALVSPWGAELVGWVGCSGVGSSQLSCGQQEPPKAAVPGPCPWALRLAVRRAAATATTRRTVPPATPSLLSSVYHADELPHRRHERAVPAVLGGPAPLLALCAAQHHLRRSARTLRGAVQLRSAGACQ